MSDFAALPAEARELAVGRYRLLAPHLEIERTLRSVADESGLPFPHSTARFERYRRFGIAALARKGRTDDSGRWVVSSRVIKAIEGLALERPPLAVASIYRQSNSSPLPWESRSQVIRWSIGSSASCPWAFQHPRTKRAKHTAKVSICSVAKPRSRTRSGRSIMLSSTYCCWGRMARPRGRGSRS